MDSLAREALESGTPNRFIRQRLGGAVMFKDAMSGSPEVAIRADAYMDQNGIIFAQLETPSGVTVLELNELTRLIKALKHVRRVTSRYC